MTNFIVICAETEEQIGEITCEADEEHIHNELVLTELLLDSKAVVTRHSDDAYQVKVNNQLVLLVYGPYNASTDFRS